MEAQAYVTIVMHLKLSHVALGLDQAPMDRWFSLRLVQEISVSPPFKLSLTLAYACQEVGYSTGFLYSTDGLSPLCYCTSCLSLVQGGMRAASTALGVARGLQGLGVLSKARYLASTSGEGRIQWS